MSDGQPLRVTLVPNSRTRRLSLVTDDRPNMLVNDDRRRRLSLASTINETIEENEEPISDEPTSNSAVQASTTSPNEALWMKYNRRASSLITRNALPPISSHGCTDEIDVDNDETAIDFREIDWSEKDRKLASSYRMQIWKLLFKCLARTSLHGLPYLGMSVRSPLKITYWVVLIIIALALMIYSLVAVSLQYGERRTFLSSQNHFPTKLPFPAVTLCNINSVRRSAVPVNFTTDQMILFLNYISAEPFLAAQVDVDGFVRMYDAVYNGSTSFLGNFGHSLDNMLLSCLFEGEYCNTSDFVTKVTSLGTCYVFNSGENRSVLSTENHGYDHGLHLILNAEEYEYFTAEDDSTGFYVFIHDPGYVPYIGAYQAFTVPAGKRTQVGITRTTYNLFQPPYGDCNDHVVLALFDDYTRESCLMECETVSAVEYCGCKAEYMPGDFRTCSLNESVRCLIAHSSQFQPQQCDCPVPCHSVVYDTKLSYASFPSSHYIQILNTTAFLSSSGLQIPDFILNSTVVNGSQVSYLNTNASREFFTSNYLSLSIFYETLAHVNVEEVVEYNSFQFFADFGGFLGFFTGAGFLTFFELIELIYGAINPSIE